MKLRTVGKLGVILSILLFVIGVGVYSFAVWGIPDRNRELNLYTYIPKDCIGVFETDNLDYLTGECAQLAYAEQLDTIQSVAIDLSCDCFKDYFRENVHQLANHVNRMAVSFHSRGEVNNHESVVYFRISDEGKQLLKRMWTEECRGASSSQETYQGKKLQLYMMSSKDSLFVYEEKGFLAVSACHQLITQVVDAHKKGNSLWKESSFTVQYQDKESNFATFYSRSIPVPALASHCSHVWSRYDFHLNSEVFYLSGDILETDSCLHTVSSGCRQVESVYHQEMWLASGRHQVDSCISATIMKPDHTLFEECVANLSREASYIMVVDMEQVARKPGMYASYLPLFLIRHASLFRSFILSVQLTPLEHKVSYIFVFTYKN